VELVIPAPNISFPYEEEKAVCYVETTTVDMPGEKETTTDGVTKITPIFYLYLLAFVAALVLK